MTVKEKSTEDLILEAAKKVFFLHGFEGARMQEIADEAGINKALLHYYFRSKDKLFEAIFNTAFNRFIPRVNETLMTDKPFFEKIWIIVEHYVDMLLENPFLPIFILHELSRNPERAITLFKPIEDLPNLLTEEIQKNVKAGIIKPIEPRQLIVNLISLCVFPFAGKPLICAAVFGNDQEQYQQFLQQRKTEVTMFVINAIKTDNAL